MKTIADINAIRERMQSEIILRDNNESGSEIMVVVGMGTCGLAAGARPVYNAIVDAVTSRGLKHVKVSRSGCLGSCDLEPVVEVHVPHQDKVVYTHVTPDKAERIIVEHVLGGNVCSDLM